MVYLICVGVTCGRSGLCRAIFFRILFAHCLHCIGFRVVHCSVFTQCSSPWQIFFSPFTFSGRILFNFCFLFKTFLFIYSDCVECIYVDRKRCRPYPVHAISVPSSFAFQLRLACVCVCVRSRRTHLLFTCAHFLFCRRWQIEGDERLYLVGRTRCEWDFRAHVVLCTLWSMGWCVVYTVIILFRDSIDLFTRAIVVARWMTSGIRFWCYWMRAHLSEYISEKLNRKSAMCRSSRSIQCEPHRWRWLILTHWD